MAFPDTIFLQGDVSRTVALRKGAAGSRRWATNRRSDGDVEYIRAAQTVVTKWMIDRVMGEPPHPDSVWAHLAKRPADKEPADSDTDPAM